MVGVPLVAAAVCPQPPVIVPEIAGGAAAELDELRAACDAAIGRLLAAEPDAVIVLGGSDRTRRLAPGYRGTFRPWGSPVGFELSGGAGEPVTTPSLLVGGWLLARHDLAGRTVMFDEIDATATAAECASLGAALAGRRPRVALLAIGDGSACRGEKSPGYDDPRAQPYDEGVAAALGGADTDALLDLDPVLSGRLMVAGRAPWQALAGAARAAGRGWRGDLSYYAAPYGVAYFVATWTPA
ncbi:hypothetical protein SAMN05444365_102451 [Micromonospora pattaloongensis]|uniref:Catalytic LigB subunit of aromatic ring-opening dioxygenase n=1 Tax=Micromonospora pattaloongensis TaxID=405436 RepID=A0A1H3KD04_9ACTN|nr:class III extradiol dioxygenase subunit B-like domain-containing protein [Micromonospora pattaloongensis]SDY50011.1 hypothetical protein SAMN05444365_102451 [Micromonospora pattaloongensis]